MLCSKCRGQRSKVLLFFSRHAVVPMRCYSLPAFVKALTMFLHRKHPSFIYFFAFWPESTNLPLFERGWNSMLDHSHLLALYSTRSLFLSLSLSFMHALSGSLALSLCLRCECLITLKSPFFILKTVASTDTRAASFCSYYWCTDVKICGQYR